MGNHKCRSGYQAAPTKLDDLRRITELCGRSGSLGKGRPFCFPFRIWAFVVRSTSFSTASCWLFSRTCAYRRVVSYFECPMSFIIVVRLSPLSRSLVAKVCRRSCRRSPSIPAVSQASWNEVLISRMYVPVEMPAKKWQLPADNIRQILTCAQGPLTCPRFMFTKSENAE